MLNLIENKSIKSKVIAYIPHKILFQNSNQDSQSETKSNEDDREDPMDFIRQAKAGQKFEVAKGRIYKVEWLLNQGI